MQDSQAALNIVIKGVHLDLKYFVNFFKPYKFSDYEPF